MTSGESAITGAGRIAADQPPHLLVVDDEPEIRRMVSICFQKCGLAVTTAENSDEACRLLVTGQYDAVISDVIMPGDDGIVFLGRVHEFWPELPVVLMTGHAQLQMAVNAIKHGAFDFVYKPFDFDHLRKVVMRAIEFRNLRRMEQQYREELEDTVACRTAELKESMAELDYARIRLQQASTEKNRFMATVSHEMRTPMNGVIGSLELLAGENLSGSAAEYLAMARQSADSMVGLIDQLLAFNSGSGVAGSVSNSDLIELQTFVQSIIVAQRPLFMHKGLVLELRLAENLPRQIWIDRDKLHRLLEILFSNAYKFTERGQVTLDVTREYEEPDGYRILFALTDSGTGIPEGMLERIFEPFSQGDSSLSRSHEGVGLGLAIARQNALLMNGRLWAEHVPDGGSRFLFSVKMCTP